MFSKRTVFGLLLILNVLVVYSNHFRNDFQFDDTKAIPQNTAIRHPSTIIRAFSDTDLFSAAPEQRVYRPVTTASLALDYWIAGGTNVFFFHLSTFVWYCVQLVLMLLFFELLMNRTDPHLSNFWTALATAALFGIHPAAAETVNFIIQRADLYNALGTIASLWVFVRYPSQRKFGWYLLPAALAILAKPPALVFPFLLLAYVFLFEPAHGSRLRKWRVALLTVLPSAGMAGALGLLLKRMQPHTWSPGHVSPALYRLTQPYVVLHYFKSFFLPTGLNIDPNWHYLNPLGVEAVAGYLFVAGIVALIVLTGRTRAGKPVAFGLIWFLVTLLPTSLMPLSDITNDHRMFFSFVGLALAVMWSARLALFYKTARLTRNPAWILATVGALALVLVAAGIGTRIRNRVWLTKESLWSDAVAKNPRNARALSNYGAYAFEQADYETALAYWERAVALDPTMPSYQSNLIQAAIKLHRHDLAEQYFRRILRNYPSASAGYTAYATWLTSIGRFDDALPLLDRALQLAPQSGEIREQRTSLYTTRDTANRSVLFRALDADHDGKLSTGELIAAPAALLALDRDGDRRLTPQECGVQLEDGTPQTGPSTQRERLRFALSSPLFRALDVNRDGEISQNEIQDAEHELAHLEREGDETLDTPELVPDYVLAVAQELMAQLDTGRTGRIDASGRVETPCQRLLAAADANADGSVTLEELTAEVFYRADQNRDGIVTRQEIDEAVHSGFLAGVLADRACTRKH